MLSHDRYREVQHVANTGAQASGSNQKFWIIRSSKEIAPPAPWMPLRRIVLNVDIRGSEGHATLWRTNPAKSLDYHPYNMKVRPASDFNDSWVTRKLGISFNKVLMLRLP